MSRDAIDLFGDLPDEPKTNNNIDDIFGDLPDAPLSETVGSAAQVGPLDATANDGFIGNIVPALKQGTVTTVKGLGYGLKANAIKMRADRQRQMRDTLANSDLAPTLTADEIASLPKPAGAMLPSKEEYDSLLKAKRDQWAKDSVSGDGSFGNLGLPGVPTPDAMMQKAGEGMALWAEQILEENPQWQQDPRLNVPLKKALTNPDLAGAYIARNLFGNIPNFAASAIVTGLTAAATRRPELAVGAGMLFTQNLEAGFSFDDLRKIAGSDEAAAETAVAVGTVNSLLEITPISRLLSRSPGLKKVFLNEVAEEFATNPMSRRVMSEAAKQALAEGTTEGLQEVMANIGKRFYDKHQDLLEGVPESVFIGALLGFATGGGAQVITPTQQKPADNGRVLMSDSEHAVDGAPLDASVLFDDLPDDGVQTGDMEGAETAGQRAQPKYEGGIDFEPVEVPKAGGPEILPGASPDYRYEGGIDFTPNKPEIPSLDATIETDAEAEKRLAQDKRIAQLRETLGDVKRPEGLDDPRILRLDYRAALEHTARTLDPGKNTRTVNPEVDDLLTAVAKAGGINMAEAEAEGIDPDQFKERGKVFGRPIFRRNGGLSMDGMAEQLFQDGYLSEYSANEMLDKLMEALSGNKIYSVGVNHDKLAVREFINELGESIQPGILEKAAKKALAGEKLGSREARYVRMMLDYIQDERTAPENIGAARERLQKARQLRKEAELGLPPVDIYNDDISIEAERYAESEYPQVLTGEERLIKELAEHALDLGGDPDVIDGFLEIESDIEAGRRLVKYIGDLNEKATAKGLPVARAQEGSGAVQGERSDGARLTAPLRDGRGVRGPESATGGDPQAEAGLQEIADRPGAETVTAPASRGLPAAHSGAPVGDMFGGKTDTQQAIHDLNVQRERAAMNAPAMHEGPGDLFSDAGKQADIRDAIQADKQAKSKQPSNTQAADNNKKNEADKARDGAERKKKADIEKTKRNLKKANAAQEAGQPSAGKDTIYEDDSGRTYKAKEFRSADEANAFMSENDGWGVIGERDGKVYVSRMNDKGLRPADTFVPRDGWRDNLIKAREYANALGIDHNGMSLREIVRAIDREITRQNLGGGRKKDLTYRIVKVDGGYIIEGANHKGVVLDGKPRGFGILSDAKPRVFGTEADARAYIRKKGMREAEPGGKRGNNKEPDGRQTKDVPLKSGARYRTVSGRITGPLPKLDYSTNRKAINSDKRLRKWLKDEAIAEAKARGDDFNLTQFDALDPGNWSQADGDSVNLYLFGDPEGRIRAREVKPESDAVEKTKLNLEKARRKAKYGSKNKIVTKERAEEIRAKLRAKLSQLNAGADPEMLALGAELAVFHIEAGARRFADFAKAMIDDLGDAARPFLRSWYEAARHWPGLDNADMTPASEIDDATIPAGGDEDAASAGGNLERDSEDAVDEDGSRQEAVFDESGRDDRRDGAAGEAAGESRPGAEADRRVPGNLSSSDGAGGNLGLFEQDGEAGAEERAAGRVDAGGGRDRGDDGARADRGAGERAVGNAGKAALTLAEKKALQDKANSLPVKPGDLQNIRETLPYLLPEQHEDVLKAERRFGSGKYGILFTNGTGTGKTYTGLGAIARHIRHTGDDNVLILVPTDPKAKDWIEDAKNLGLSVTQLTDKRDAGKGIVVTTYANFRDNWELQGRDFSLVVYDESHYLGQNSDPNAKTAAFVAHRAITGHPDGLYDRLRFRDPEAKALEYERRAFINDAIKALKAGTASQRIIEAAKLNSRYDPAALDVEAVREQLGKSFYEQNRGRYDAIHHRLRLAADELEKNPPERAKVVFLSASPFAYHFSLDYAEGFLYDIPRDKGEPVGYNAGSPRDRFYMENFGYRMRYNRLTKPEKGVNVDLMERNFHEKLKKEGAVSGRQLDVPFDYSRQFVLVDSDLGRKVDEGINILRGFNPDGSPRDKLRRDFELIPEAMSRKFNYTYLSQLMESIKAQQIPERIEKHLSMGRKVVVFHDFQKGVSKHPFDLSDLRARFSQESERLQSEIRLFYEKYPEYRNLPLNGMGSVVETLKRRFGDRVRVINGRVSSKEKMEAKRLFNDDDSGVDIIVVQRQAGREGLSLHDTTGKHQRVLLDLGLPVAPVDAIQTEGRIFRVNVQSNAVFEYPVLHVGFERTAFAMKVAERARTAENLAMGNMARDLERAFREGYINADDTPPSADQGVGGKEMDRRAVSDDPFDVAKTYYYARQKNTKRRDSREGLEYYSTPEPVGLKMVEWAGIRPNERALEPSAGHGAIARFFPEHSSNTFIEPSAKLAAEVQLLSNGEALAQRFEDLPDGSRFDAIVMNPPYLRGGKTAMEHLSRAMNHLKNGGRIVALLPQGPSADKRLDALLYGRDGEEENLKKQLKSGIISSGEYNRRIRQIHNFHVIADISLPTVTFERAGTSVKTHIVVIDRYDDAPDNLYQTRVELDNAESVEELFDRIRDLGVPERRDVSTGDADTAGDGEAAPDADTAPDAGSGRTSADASAYLSELGIEVKEATTKNGTPVWEVSGDTYEYRSILGAKSRGGLGGKWYGPKKVWSFYDGDPTEAIAEAIRRQNDTARFSRKPPASAGVSVSEAQEAIQPMLDAWKNAPQTVVVKSVDELPGHIIDYLLHQDATEDVGGLYDLDTETVWLVAENLRDTDEAVKVLLHEAMGHYGLRQLFGKDVEAILNEVYLAFGRKGLADIAKRYGLDLSKRADRLVAAEEKLAHMAENGENPRLLDRIITKIRELIRRIVPSLRLSRAEVRVLLERAGRAVKDGGGRSDGMAGHGARLSRGKNSGSGYNSGGGTRNAQEESVRPGRRERSELLSANRPGLRSDENLVRTVSGRAPAQGWTRATRVRRADGKPAATVRGSQVQLSPDHFTKEALGHTTGHPSSGLGVWFSSDASEVKRYGPVREIFYLDIRNPKQYIAGDLPGFDSVEEAYRFREKLRAQGYDGIIIDGRPIGGPVHYVAFSPDQVIRKGSGVMLSRRNSESSPEQSVLERVKEGRPLDSVFYAMFKPLDAAVKAILGIKSDVPFTQAAEKKIEKLITEARFKPEGSMAWMNPIIEKARAGLIDRYGLDDEYIQRDREREADEALHLDKLVDLLGMLNEAGISAEESKVLHAVLTGERVPDERWSKLAKPIRKAIDELGQEAVVLGLLDQATYERNRATYLHRVYKKYEAEQSLGAAIVNKVMSKYRKRVIIGNQLKRRGMTMKASAQKLTEGLPGWFGKKEGGPDSALMGRKFRVFDRLEAVGQGTADIPGVEEGGRKPRTLERVYWPADKPVPAKYRGWEDRGEWEVTGFRNGKYELWRDFTKEERRKMGEILDARYAIARTFQVMSHDLSTGRFFKDIAENPAWTWHEEGEPDSVAEANRTWGTYSGYEWVKVPDTNIPGTSKKRWGALAGKYVRAEIWRDLNQLEVMRRPRVWNAFMTQWKLNKTARNPVVHMNNVMSNLIFMDMADVRFVDLRRAIYAMRHKTKEYQDARRHGAFGSGYVQQELRRDILEPMLDEILQQSFSGKGWAEAQLDDFGGGAKTLGKALDTIWRWAKKADAKMIQIYQLEDEIFRMATYLSRIHKGDSPADAAHFARDQFLNYDIRAPWVNAARATFLPFIAYTYRAVPVIARSIAARPWKLAKYAVIAEAVNALGYAMAPGDEDEERRSMRDEVQGYTWIGAQRMLRMPFRDAYGNPVFLDIRRWIPAGDVFDTNQGQSAIPIPAPLQFSGPLMLAAELALNKTAFTGEAIVDDTDTAGEKAAKVADWAWKSWMPAAIWVWNSWYWDKFWTAADGGRDVLGRRYELKYAVASAAGIKLAPQDVDLNMNWRMREIMFELAEYRDDLRRNELDYSRGLVSLEAYKETKQRIKKKIRALSERAQELSGKR